MDDFVLTSVLLVTASTYGAEIADGKPLTMKPLLGGWFFGLFLYVVSEADEHLANLFAVLILVTALLVNGSKFIPKLTGLTGYKPTTPTKATI